MSRRTHLVPVLAFLICGAPAAAEAGWTYIGSSGDDQTKLYVDYDTLKVDGGKRTIWELWNYVSPQTAPSEIGGSYISLILLEQFDCDKNMMSAVQGNFYSGAMGGGQFMGQRRPFASESAIAPQTMGQIVRDAVCK